MIHFTYGQHIWAEDHEYPVSLNPETDQVRYIKVRNVHQKTFIESAEITCDGFNVAIKLSNKPVILYRIDDNIEHEGDEHEELKKTLGKVNYALLGLE